MDKTSFLDKTTINNLVLYLEKQEMALQEQYLVLTISQRRLQSNNLVNKGTNREQEETMAALSEIKVQKDKITQELRHLEAIKRELAGGKFKFE